MKALQEERALVLAGLIGLAAVGFSACGDSDTSASGGGGSSAGGSAATSTGGSGGSGGTVASGGSTSTGGGGSALGCTSSEGTVANTTAVVAAANALLATLTSAEKTTIQLDDTLANVQQWSNLPTTAVARNGLMLGDMSAAAEEAAVALVTAATGTAGATLFSELRAADEWLVTDGHAQADSYGEGRYYLAFVGTPSSSKPWTLQIAGHHLAYNFTYNGPCTSATPLFDGVEPTTWTDASDVSHAPLEAQRASSVAVIAAISGNADAVLAGTFSDVVNGPTNQDGKGDTRYPKGITYPNGTTGRGVLVGTLSAADQTLVKTAIEAWVRNAADPIAEALLADYESTDSLAKTYVAYSGAVDLTTQNSYFRIDGPRVWIEYTVQGGIVYRDRVHYHTIWRDKASDYGAEYADADSGGTSSSTAGSGGPPGSGGGPPGSGGGPPGN